MSYKLEFNELSFKEWQKLDNSIKQQFKKKLVQILQNPVIPASQLSGLENCYKIKLRNSGYRLVYRVKNEEVVVLVVAVGKRDKSLVYKHAAKRLK